ncbi:hypothetical protein PIB30_029613 [Stylosanthes scabra]|uniref:Uncharacterized protein n=1 Tax=Stylosanthes scabra TaxID=79078 RepID=A0ABU6QBH2_9FABA|nr:hypothetical protein [Stylosanthes scabra]
MASGYLTSVGGEVICLVGDVVSGSSAGETMVNVTEVLVQFVLEEVSLTSEDVEFVIDDRKLVGWLIGWRVLVNRCYPATDSSVAQTKLGGICGTLPRIQLGGATTINSKWWSMVRMRDELRWRRRRRRQECGYEATEQSEPVGNGWIRQLIKESGRQYFYR